MPQSHFNAADWSVLIGYLVLSATVGLLQFHKKESAEDYMYFSEPDLVPIMPEAEWVEGIRRDLPEAPLARQVRFVADYGLPEYDAQVLTETFTDGNGQPATVYLTATPDLLVICMRAQIGLFANRFGRVYLDPQGDGSGYVYANAGDDDQRQV